VFYPIITKEIKKDEDKDKRVNYRNGGVKDVDPGELTEGKRNG
jgi:hypothetical protein